MRIAGFSVSALQYDVSKLVTSRTLTGQWFVVLVFDNRSDASNALRDSRERQAMRSYGLTVITHGNVVATILRGDATRDRVTRVRAAVEQATGG